MSDERLTRRPLNPVEVDDLIVDRVNELAHGIEISRGLHEAYLSADREYDYAFALAWGKAVGPQGDKRYKAEVEAFSKREARDIADAAWRYHQRRLEAIQTEIDALRTLGANLRETYRGGGGDGRLPHSTGTVR